MLGYLPQELGLYPDLTGRQLVDYMAILKGLDDAVARRRRVGEVLELVGLSHAADRRLKVFSGGMKRRIGIAQALVNRPRILIVDEPTAGLDPEERIRFRNLLADLAADRVIILSTHIVEAVGQTCAIWRSWLRGAACSAAPRPLSCRARRAGSGRSPRPGRIGPEAGSR